MGYRDETKVVQIGKRQIGGGNPILIQSMCNTKTEDVKATVEQILALDLNSGEQLPGIISRRIAARRGGRQPQAGRAEQRQPPTLMPLHK